MKNFSRAFATALVLSAISLPASAEVYDFTFTTTLDTATISGTAPGETVTYNVFADNGGSTDLNQTWAQAGAYFTISTPGFFGTYSQAYENSQPLFVTNALGEVTSSGFYGTDNSSVDTDNFGTTTGDFVDGYGDFTATNDSGYDTPTVTFLTATWLVAPAVSAVPEPSSLPMLLAGLGLIGGALYFGRKKQVSDKA